MTFDEIYETLPGNGWLSKPEAELLWNTVATCEGPILEVGCHQGRSTVLLASFGRPVYAVDPFAGFDTDDKYGYKTLAKFRDNLDIRKIPAMNGEQAWNHTGVMYWIAKIENWPLRMVRFAYLDGDHTRQGTINQIKVALECGAKTIAIHDVNDSGDGLAIKNAALFMLGNWDKRVERLAVWTVKPTVAFNVGDADCISPPIGHKA